MNAVKKSVYIETSVLSFLCADPSSVQKTFEKQRDTHQWWDHYRRNYTLYLSDEVMLEAAKGDPNFANRRLEKAGELQLVLVDLEDRKLATELVAHHLLPAESMIDATHLAIAVRLKLDILLTWNLKHLANPYVMPLMYNFLKDARKHIPVIMTPSGLLEFR